MPQYFTQQFDRRMLLVKPGDLVELVEDFSDRKKAGTATRVTAVKFSDGFRQKMGIQTELFGKRWLTVAWFRLSER